ncbi:MAG TPA: PrsW family intramembrane metalloprotease [Streptosporangiaceae bacterium]|nr:PrsW family intramembrane metalloprotease [Streptosporangiaceae bacterium]
MASVDPKAVLEGRTPGRVPIGLIIGLALSSACALVALILYAANGQSAGFVVGLIMAVLPVPLLVSLVLLLDRLEPEPWRDLLFAFMWGAGVAVLGALILNTLGYEYLTQPKFGSEQGHWVTAVVGAPVIEESFKGAVLFGFLWFRRDEIDGLTDGIVYACMVALGFAMMENVAYYMRAFNSGGAHQLELVFILRSVLAPFGHPLFTSMTGLGVAYAAMNRGAGRLFAPLAGLLCAMGLHAAWNASTSYGMRGLLVVYVFDLCILAGLIGIVIWERKRLVQLIGDYLPQYSHLGLVTPQDVYMLGGMSRRRQARAWARRIGGTGASRAMADYQLAATEVALVHERYRRGIANQAWFERRRNSLLGLMGFARAQFVVRPSQPVVPPWTAGGPSVFGPAGSYETPPRS